MARDPLGLDREAALEVGVDRHSHAAGDRAQVRQRLLQRHAVVRPAQRPGEAGAGGRQRREAQLREQAGAAEVPRVGDHEAAGLVQLAEALPSFCEGGHSRRY